MDKELRFKQFVEKYVLARAGTFDLLKEREQGWQSILDAKAIFKMIEQQAEEFSSPLNVHQASQQGAQVAPFPFISNPHAIARAQQLLRGDGRLKWGEDTIPG